MKIPIIPLVFMIGAALGGSGGWFAHSYIKSIGPASSSAKEATSAADATTLVKFSRQFVVPLTDNGRHRGLVALDLFIEVQASASENAYDMEVQLRDAFLTVLLGHSERGELLTLGASPATLEKVRANLLAAARSLLGESARAILITDVVVQAR